MPSSRVSGPQSLASSRVPSDSCQTVIHILDGTILYCWCMDTDLKLVPVLQEVGRYITSNTSVQSGDRLDPHLGNLHTRQVCGPPARVAVHKSSRGSDWFCNGRPGRPKVMVTGPPPGCYTMCCHTEFQNNRTRNTQTLGFSMSHFPPNQKSSFFQLNQTSSQWACVIKLTPTTIQYDKIIKH